jgi:hypothetical protein
VQKLHYLTSPFLSIPHHLFHIVYFHIIYSTSSIPHRFFVAPVGGVSTFDVADRDQMLQPSALRMQEMPTSRRISVKREELMPYLHAIHAGRPVYARLLALLICILAVGTGIRTGADEGKPLRPLPYRWLYLGANLASEESLLRTEALMRRAAKAGYTGIVLTDYNLHHLATVGPSYVAHAERMKVLAKGLKLEIIPCMFSIGYSGGILMHDPNLIEGMPVRDALFQVHGGKADIVADPTATLKNGGFEEANGDRVAGWDSQDDPGKVTFVDHQVAHGGGASLRIANVADMPENHGRIMQRLALQPFHCYRLSFWARSRALRGDGEAKVLVLPSGPNSRNLSYMSLGIKENQDWTLHQVLFNSQTYREATLYIGIWGRLRGDLWIDDAKLEEMGLLNVVRREGCPLKVSGEDGTVYQEGRDFEPVRDPELGAENVSHTPPSIVLTPNSRIGEGARLRVSFYHSVYIYSDQAVCCLTHPKVIALLRDEAERIEKLFHPTAVFMCHDEIRVANWCEVCQQQHKTPGQLLADNVRRCIGMVKEFSPHARIYVWSDMFDPYQNAHDNYYLVNGTWEGSWEGLTPDVHIVDWDFDIRKKDMPWFADRGHKQVLAGYYDGDVDYTVTWLKDSLDVKGVEGVMYTTWANHYDDLEKYAQAVWGGGP